MVVDLRDRSSFGEMPYLGPQHTRMLVHRSGVFRAFRNIIHPPCQCAQCAQQFRSSEMQESKTLTYTNALNDFEAQEEATRLVQSICKDRQYLKEQCELNGNIIMTKWKKSSKKSQAVLLDVDPGLYPHQWCDAYFCHDMMEKSLAIEAGKLTDVDAIDFTTGSARRQVRNVCLIPYINLEQLKAEPSKLLSLLYNRVKYTPEEWAPYDSFLISKQWELGALECDYNPNCIAMFGEKYGKLTGWDQREVHSWRSIGYPRAAMILQAQQYLLNFLRRVVEVLLKGVIGHDHPPQSNVFLALELGWKRPNKNSGVVEFASLYLNQPFSAPLVFDMQALTSIAETQFSMYGDHLWLLQTDPCYTRLYAAVILLGVAGEIFTKEQRNCIVSNRMMRDAVVFFSWEGILEELRNLEAAHSKVSRHLQPGQHLTAPYDGLMASVEALLDDQVQRSSRCLSLQLPTRPAFSHKFTFQSFSNPHLVGFVQQRKESMSVPELFFSDRLEWCLATLVTNNLDSSILYTPHHAPRHDPAILLGALDEHLSNCSRDGRKDELARLDEVLYSDVSDLAALHQMISTVRLHRPCWTTTRAQAKSYGTSKAWRYINGHFFDQDPTVRLDGQMEWREDADKKFAAANRLGALFQEFLGTLKPTGSQLRQEWLDMDGAQQAALNRFWAAVRDRHQSILVRLAYQQEDIDSDINALSANNNPEYILKLQEEREDILTRMKSVEEEREVLRDLERTAAFSLVDQWATKATPKDELKKLKIKVKTCFESNQPEVLTPSELEPASAKDGVQPHVIKASVTKNTFSVFRSMFPDRNCEDASQKEVRWDSFVQAMAENEVGFVARHTSGGSAVQFGPNEASKWFGKGKIVFHKPHPVPVIDPVMLLSMGKRMRKWFGRDKNTFMLEEKK